MTPDMGEMFASPRNLLRWAQLDFDEIKSTWNFYIDSKPWKWHEIAGNGEKSTIVELWLTEPTPDNILKSLNSCFNNIKHCFDQALHVVGKFHNPSKDKFNFPWADTRKEVEIKCSKLGLGKELIDVILSFGTYKADGLGGDNTLRAFASAANPNKHVLAIGLIYAALPSHYQWDVREGITLNGSVMIEIEPIEIDLLPVEIGSTFGVCARMLSIDVELELVFKGDSAVKNMLVVPTLNHTLLKANGFVNAMEYWLNSRM